GTAARTRRRSRTRSGWPGRRSRRAWSVRFGRLWAVDAPRRDDLSTNGERRVVVTGMGTLNPLGKTVEEYWDGMIEGRSGAAPLEGFDSTRLTTKFACQVHGFEPSDYMDRKLANRSARFTQFALATAGQAIADAD